MKAILNKVRISPKKANLIAWIIRNMEANKALALLKFMNKKGAWIIYKLLASAVANAENNFSQKKEELIISKIFVTEWSTYKRGQSRSKWRVFSLLKRTANINLELWLNESKEDLLDDAIDLKSDKKESANKTDKK